MPMEGTSLHFDHITTSFGSVHSTNAVVGAGVEFTYSSFFSIDVTGRDIKYTASTAGIFNPGGFNGVIISDYLDVLPDFTAISVIVNGGGGAINPSRYWVEAQEIHLNFEGLSLSGLDGITFRVVLGDVPTAIGLSHDTVIEGVSGAIIGDLTTVDADQSSGHVYTVDDARFEVVAGQLKLKDGVALDYASDPTVPITVMTTDEWGNAFEQVLTITVNQDNPPPPPPSNHRPTILSPRLQDVVEGSKTAFTVRAHDLDGDALTYSISGGRDGDAFTIDPVTGQLSFRYMPDFVLPGSAAGTNSYLVTASVSDGRLITTRNFEVNVIELDRLHVVGTSADDQFSTTGSPTHFIGLSGLDTMKFSGAISNYTIEKGQHGILYVTGLDGTDKLESIERLVFKDGTLAFDFDGTAGQAYRLYQAAFDRAPDAEGLGFWLGYLDDGKLDLNAIADLFEASVEFIQRYGDADSISNSDYLDLLFQNALGRQADPDGFAFWLDILESGAIDRGDVLAFFSESPENFNQVLPAVTDGMWYA